MFEVALCISLYVGDVIEFSPTFMEKWGMKDARRKLNKVMFFIALGTVLPMMHQSSLGSLLIVFGTQIHPLWQTMLLPLLFLLSAITIGYAVVLFESCSAAAGYRRSIDASICSPRWQRSCSACWRCSCSCASATCSGAARSAMPSPRACRLLMFWLETACFLSPFVLLRSERQRRNPARLFVGGALLMLGGVLLRINASLVGYDTGSGWSYFPDT